MDVDVAKKALSALEEVVDVLLSNVADGDPLVSELEYLTERSSNAISQLKWEIEKPFVVIDGNEYRGVDARAIASAYEHIDKRLTEWDEPTADDDVVYFDLLRDAHITLAAIAEREGHWS
jgi:hypothetical protein